VEGWTLAIGLLPVLLAALAGWFWFDPTVFAASWNPKAMSAPSAVGASALTAFWAFLGVECAAAAAGVVRDPASNVPRATLVGVVAVAALYIGACSALMGILPTAVLAQSTAPFAEGARVAAGVGLGAAIAFCALLRAFGCLSGWTLVASETSRSAADEGVFLPLFRTRPGERASAINLVTIGVLTSGVAVLTASPSLGEQFATLANVAVVLSLYCYVLAGLSLSRLAAALTPGPRMGARLTALAAMGCSLALIATAKPVELALSVVPLAAAALLYLWLRRR
jgi:arginine:agmatine antiporter